MNTLKKSISIGCAVMLVLFSVVTAFAETDANASQGKEEVVYAILNASGEVDGIYVVNIFGAGDVVDYGDYTRVQMLNTSDAINYTDGKVTFSTSADKACYQGDMADAELPWNIFVRYKINGASVAPEALSSQSGALEIEWVISQNYAADSAFFDHYSLQAAITLDTEHCKNIQAEGATKARSGSDMKLTYIILPDSEQNIKVTADVTDFCMEPIQINGLLMDMADSIDFDAGDIDLSEYETSLDDLKDGAADLDSGAEKVYNGVVDISDGASDISDGASALYKGLKNLKSNSASLNSGAEQMVNSVFAAATIQLRDKLVAAGMSEADAANYTLTVSNYVSVIAGLSSASPTETQISQAETQIRATLSGAGIFDAANQDTAMTLAYQLLQAGSASTVNSALSAAGSYMADGAFVQTAIAAYSADPTAQALAASLTADPYNMDASTAAAVACTATALNAADPTSEVANAIIKVQNAGTAGAVISDAASLRALCVLAVEEQLAASSGEYAALKAQLDEAAGFLSGVKTYTAGVSSLTSGALTLVSGASTLKAGAEALLSGAKALANGTDSLHSETRDINTDLSSEVQNKVDEVIADFGNDDYTPVSFASAKNTTISSVQFVIKISGIDAKVIAVEEPEAVETPTFWNKLGGLFVP